MAYDAEEKVISKIAEQGACVIIGRCASAIIPKEKRLSVFIYADDKDKVRRVMERNKLNEKDAAKRIKHMDRMRKQFFDFYSDTIWGNPESYDVMLSSSKFGTDGCVKMISDAIRKMEESENE
ncbi:MAG: cytidylate kinase-like family protein [Eubacteriales bacterium]|nr:cytidylate kinase-like family protein [Eubacteriales bacterium]